MNRNLLRFRYLLPLYYYYNSDIIEKLINFEIKSLGIDYVDNIDLLIFRDIVKEYLRKIKVIYSIYYR